VSDIPATAEFASGSWRCWWEADPAIFSATLWAPQNWLIL